MAFICPFLKYTKLTDLQKYFLNLHNFWANVNVPCHRGSNCTLPVLIHNDSIL